MGNGASDVSILAYDGSRISKVFSAERIATVLLDKRNSRVYRKNLPIWYYGDEYLVYSGIHGDNYALLAVIPGDIGDIDVQIGSRTIQVPRSLVDVPQIHPTTVTMSLRRNTEVVEEELLVQIYSHTGCVDRGKHGRLMHALGG